MHMKIAAVVVSVRVGADNGLVSGKLLPAKFLAQRLRDVYKRQLHTFDEYFKLEAAETVFEKAGKKITPKLLLEAIRTLPEEKRKAILPVSYTHLR